MVIRQSLLICKHVVIITVLMMVAIVPAATVMILLRPSYGPLNCGVFFYLFIPILWLEVLYMVIRDGFFLHVWHSGSDNNGRVLIGTV